jgi:hypothetical protein
VRFVVVVRSRIGRLNATISADRDADHDQDRYLMTPIAHVHWPLATKCGQAVDVDVLVERTLDISTWWVSTSS